jgi:hypothetical protein
MSDTSERVTQNQEQDQAARPPRRPAHQDTHSEGRLGGEVADFRFKKIPAAPPFPTRGSST